jgi:hypothetical protein
VRSRNVSTIHRSSIDYLYRLGSEAIQRSAVDLESDDRLTGPLYFELGELIRRESEDAMARSPDFRGLMTLLSYSFWSRVWIIQKLVLASSFVIFCGNATLQGSDLEAFLGTVMRDSSKQEIQPYFTRLTVLFFVSVFAQGKATNALQFERSSFLAFSWVNPWLPGI